jgi:trehalose 6-phosphate phosphatase
VTSTLRHEVLELLRTDPTHAAVLLDIDGTLAPIVEHAADATVPEPTRQLLIEISRRYGLVACISGRRASEARAMVSIGTISYLGSHGAELLRAGWTEAAVDPEFEEWARRVGEFTQRLNAAELRRRRVRLEDKGAIVALHWRGAPDEDAAKAMLDVIAAQAEATGLAVHWGRKVLELRPPLQLDKGAGVRALLDQAPAIDLALYAGDDRTDVDAFRALADLVAQGRLRGVLRVAVRSAEGPPELLEEADLTVDGTGGMRELLVILTGS